MWTPDDWWVGEEKSESRKKEIINALKIVSDKVLEYDWDSSGYGYMMRIIEAKIKAMPVVKAVVVEDNLQDDKPKFTGDPHSDKGIHSYGSDVQNPEEEDERLNKIEQGKNFAKCYQQTYFGKAMDEKNKKALNVMANKGADEAAKYMMDMAGGDYSRMRSMFG